MGRPRILVIDDEREIRETLADILGMDGPDVQTASDGRDSLERIGRNPFDLILCDLRMPEMDGRALYDEVRRDYPQTLKHIVFVTAQAHEPEYGPVLRENGAPVLDKPFTIHQLRHIVERMVGRGRHALR
jgi:CheY-like chemotaxis protein